MWGQGSGQRGWGEEFEAVQKSQKDRKGQRTENNVARLSFSFIQIQLFFCVSGKKKRSYLRTSEQTAG